MQKMIAALSMTGILCVGTACGLTNSVQETEMMPATATEDIAATTEAATEGVAGLSSVTSAEGVDWKNDALCAAAFIDYTATIEHDLRENPFFTLHPDLADAESVHTYAFEIGDEVFYLLPRYADAVVTIEEIDTNGQALGVLYEGLTEPIVFTCNMSDLYANTRVTVTSGRSSVSFSPHVSMIDGGIEIAEGEPVQNLDIGRRSNVSNAIIGGYVGEWVHSLKTEDGEVLLSFINLHDDGTMVYALGAAESEFDLVMEGSYTCVFSESGGVANLPEGVIQFDLQGEISALGDEDEVSDDDRVFAAGLFSLTKADDDTASLRHVDGDELPWYAEDNSSGRVYIRTAE